MKKILTLTIFSLIVALVGCNTPSKTIENLKAAANGEMTASTKYAQFAKRATADSMFRVAAMLEATSKAEAIHAANHVAQLKALGVEYTPKADAVVVDSTLSNLYAAKAGEEYEIQSMYPEFIDVAKGETASDAVRVFEWAMEAELKHAEYYIMAIEALQNFGNDEALYSQWVVCPKCGDTHRKDEAPNTCMLCGVSSADFLNFSAAVAPVELEANSTSTNS